MAIGDRPLADAYLKSVAAVRQADGSFQDNSLPINQRGLAAAKTYMTQTVQPPRRVPEATFNKLLTVIAQADAGNGSSKADLFKDLRINNVDYPGQMTIDQFLGLEDLRRTDVLNAAWNRVSETKVYDTLPTAMSDPQTLVIADRIDPMPSGIVPGANGGFALGWQAPVTNMPDAFKTLCVGFRVDGSGANRAADIARVSQDGLTCQLANLGLMQDIKRWTVDGTTVHTDTTRPRVWRTKNDIFNESAVCVSRNFYGATAFPMRETGTEAAPVPAVLWAVDCDGVQGFDTEAYQAGLPNARQWRPGEKAFPTLQAAKCIGYVEISRLGAPAEGGWKFQIAADATWTWLPGWQPPALAPAQPTRADRIRAYVTGQLNAWRGALRTIPAAFDFAT